MRKTHYKDWMLMVVFGVIMSTSAICQQRVVTGIITDENSEPMPGINILVKGTTIGSATDSQGKFAIEVPGDESVLVISFIGYQTIETTVGARTSFAFQMNPDVQTLTELVVTGYTTENRRDVTGAVSTVKTEELVAVPSGNIEQQLQGRVPGVTVITNGQPGTTSVVRIRGFGGFGGNEPLLIVDGVPVGSSDFLQPDDIESTTVLKDAASASIYGARAANGVIVYTTKKGKKGAGALKVNYNGVFGFTVPGKVNNTLNPQETADWTWKAISNTAFQNGTTPVYNHPQYGSGQSPVLPDYLAVGAQSGVIGTIDMDAESEKYNVDLSKGSIYQVIKANKTGTNWWDEITRVAPLNRHNLSFSGGGEKSSFYLGLGLQDQKGIILHQDFKRYSIRLNSQHSMLKRVRVGENFQMSYISIRGLIGGNGGRGAANEETDILSAFRMPSIIPVYDEFGGYAGTAAKGFNNPRNPVASRNRSKDNGGYSVTGFGNVYTEIDILKNLMFRSSIGGALGNSYTYSYSPPTYENSENTSSYTYSEGAEAGYNWTFTNTMQYNHKIGNHAFDVMAGIEALNTGTTRNISGSGQNPFSTDVNYISITNTQSSGRVVNSSYEKGSNFFSMFGQFKYSYNDKYYFTGLLRRDGSSRFGAEERYGTFPAVSAAWRISEENFMASNSFISDLKIRGGWGKLGNSNNVDPMNQFNLFASSVSLSTYDITGSNSGVTEGFYRSRIGNPNAKWETSTTSNIGFDGSFLDGKVDVIFDLWRKDTDDLLYTLETAAVVGGLAADPAINIAKMRNQGIDIEVITRATAFSVVDIEIKGSGSFLQNEIIALAPGVTYFDDGSTRNGNVIRNQVGQSISSYYGYKVQGLFQTQEEVDAAPAQEGKGLGRFRYEDIDKDGSITTADRTNLGSPVPKFTGGLNLKVNYKNFELESFLSITLGLQNYNFSKWFTDFYPSFTGAAIGTNVRDSWTPENGGNTVPIFENISNFSNNTQSTSYYVENGNYARLTNLLLAYKLPSEFINRYGIVNARIYVQGTNIFTITKYSGLDPGVGGQADTTLGLDIGNAPVTRGFNIGVNLTF